MHAAEFKSAITGYDFKMITFLEGIIEVKTPTRIVLNLGGVGYELFVPLSTYDALPGIGDACRLLTFDYPREDQHLLYGFFSEREREAFLMLIDVNGIGPKLALTALSGISVRDLCSAIASGDTRRLSSISGIGKKLAERMLVELRDRVTAISGELAAVASGGGGGADRRGGDAVAALMALGYRAAEAERMVSVVLNNVDASTSVEQIIRKALSG